MGIQYAHLVSLWLKWANRGIKHNFPFTNICKIQREVLKTEGEAQGFQPSRGTLQMLKVLSHIDHRIALTDAERTEKVQKMFIRW